MSVMFVDIRMKILFNFFLCIDALPMCLSRHHMYNAHGGQKRVSAPSRNEVVDTYVLPGQV